MKQIVRFILVTVVLVAVVAVVAGAVLLYRQLSGRPGVQPGGSQPSGPANTGRATDFTVFDADGRAVRLSDFFGKPIVVNFWATWCGYCRAEMPAFEAVSRRHAGEVAFMMVDLTDGYREMVEGAKAFLADKGYTFPAYFDTEGGASRVYSVSSIPLTLLIGRDGSVYKYHLGALSEETLEGYVQTMLSA